MPFRDNPNPYWVTVSELMLQQTQVSTVLKKFPTFINRFPSFDKLAKASLSSVLEQWLGLGYNRRAKYLQQIAQKTISDFNGALPLDPEMLVTFPGIGKGTAASIYVFTTNNPYVFIETNIRRIMIHHFFGSEGEKKENNEMKTGSEVIARREVIRPTWQSHEITTLPTVARNDTEKLLPTKISDQDLLPYVEATLDQTNPREWYYALMDYGTYLATQVVNPNRQSKHYHRQSPFEGSLRQVRGEILRCLIPKNLTQKEIEKMLKGKKKHLAQALKQLETEGFIQSNQKTYQIVS